MSFREGQRFVVLRDVEAKCFVHLVSCRPHRYEALGVELVDRETRENPCYEGYGLVIESSVVTGNCKPLEVGP